MEVPVIAPYVPAPDHRVVVARRRALGLELVGHVGTVKHVLGPMCLVRLDVPAPVSWSRTTVVSCALVWPDELELLADVGVKSL